MGVLSRIFGKEKMHNRLEHFARALSSHFNNLKEDFETQKKWMDYLHNFSLRLQNDHHDHRSITESEINNVKSWINHLHNYQVKQEKDIKDLQKNISELVSVVGNAFDDVHTRIQTVEDKHSDSGKKIYDDVQKLLTEHKPEPKPKDVPPQQETYPMQNYHLSNPENKLLNLLLTQSDPIGYAKIAEKTGNSINTVRVVMNSLKKKGFVEENLLPSGEKLFNAKNKEKIKKMYNISHI